MPIQLVLGRGQYRGEHAGRSDRACLGFFPMSKFIINRIPRREFTPTPDTSVWSCMSGPGPGGEGRGASLAGMDIGHSVLGVQVVANNFGLRALELIRSQPPHIITHLSPSPVTMDIITCTSRISWLSVVLPFACLCGIQCFPFPILFLRTDRPSSLFSHAKRVR